MFFDEQEKNQSRVDSVVNEGNRLVKENSAAQKDEENIKDTINNVQNSWDTIIKRLFDVEKWYVSRFVKGWPVREGVFFRKGGLLMRRFMRQKNVF